MSGSNRSNLAQQPDFDIGHLRVCPSACRVVAGGNETRIEAQTMAVLVVLARADRATVSRDELIEACWDGRIVSDDAVVRTIAKVRALARGLTPVPFTLETIPKVGYRLLPADAPAALGIASETAAAAPPPRAGRGRSLILMTAMGIAAIAVVWGILAKAPMQGPAHAASVSPAPNPSAAEVSDALWTLNEPRLLQDLQRGWDLSWPLDSEGNAALHLLMLVCERNRTHDQARLLSIAQYLVTAGADPKMRNKWGDTPLMIAATPKYCGPDHPVVAFLRSASEK